MLLRIVSEWQRMCPTSFREIASPARQVASRKDLGHRRFLRKRSEGVPVQVAPCSTSVLRFSFVPHSSASHIGLQRVGSELLLLIVPRRKALEGWLAIEPIPPHKESSGECG